jgi:nucleoside-diphosphate-sugar epimerase
MSENKNPTAVVVGATGIIGSAIVAKLSEVGGWRTIAVAQSGRTVPGADEAIGVDLMDSADAHRKLAAASEASHLFFAAYAPRPGWIEEVQPNLALLVNTIEGLESVGAPLKHVTLITGAKYYGVHVGLSTSPAIETEPRHVGPNFYYAQEDYLRSRADSSTWQWTNLISTHLTGFAVGNAMNLVLSIAVYASIVREVGLRLDFPGSAAAFGAMTQIVDAEQVAAAALWAAETPQAAGEMFNISNGDPTRWSQLWPVFAADFGVPLGGPRPVPLAGFMAEYASLWKAMATKYNLVNSDLSALVNWQFLEFMFAIDYDIVLALGKIRRAGFTSHPDTTEAFKRRFQQYRQERIIPDFANL